MEFRKITLYFGDRTLLHPELLLPEEIEAFKEAGYTEDDFGKIHLKEVCSDYILNPMHAIKLFWDEIYKTLKSEAYNVYKNVLHYQIVTEDMETTEVYKINDNEYSFVAELTTRVFNPSEMDDCHDYSNPCIVHVETIEFLIKI